MIPWIFRSIGFGLFCVSFFLPAVGLPGGGFGPDRLPGYLCAGFSLALLAALPKKLLTALFTHGRDPSPLLPYPLPNSLELFGAALVVPLVLTYLLLCLAGPQSRFVRRWVAIGVLAGLACAWCFLEFPGSMPSSDIMTPMIGHYLWTLGTLLIISPEIVPNSTKKPVH
jgi:hypothetical protein